METMTATFDTLAASSALRTSGFTEPQANALTEVVRDVLRTVATKADLEKATTATSAELEKLEYRLEHGLSAMGRRLDGMATKADLEHGLSAMGRLDRMATKADLEKATMATRAELELAIANLRDELKSHTNRQTAFLGVFLGLLVTLLGLLG